MIKFKKLNISEGISDIGTPDLKYYAFDWDDNILEIFDQNNSNGL